ncbi:Arm DNA-binding domain-containing protein [Dysgonomonas massiliensis]|uniref:Arm DNA-binding domain-containing protein n=1 Tax=Dysgonomonas massiliensis TaxID=2040292 RepID=UPI001FE5ACE1|nr:Arm DNA-binding domain-containing protein [Dysgonomonas massiliensis]
MMEIDSFNVLLFLKKIKLLKNVEASVCMRIIVNRVRVETSIRKRINHSLWNQAKECLRGKDRKSNDLNKFIDEARIS